MKLKIRPGVGNRYHRRCTKLMVRTRYFSCYHFWQLQARPTSALWASHSLFLKKKLRWMYWFLSYSLTWQFYILWVSFHSLYRLPPTKNIFPADRIFISETSSCHLKPPVCLFSHWVSRGQWSSQPNYLDIRSTRHPEPVEGPGGLKLALLCGGTSHCNTLGRSQNDQ